MNGYYVAASVADRYPLRLSQPRLQKMRIAPYFTLITLSAVVTCSPAASLSFAEQTRLMGGAQLVIDAVRRGDAQVVAAHTSHLIARVGLSMDSIVRSTQDVATQAAASGMSLDSAELGQPSALYEATGAEVCFIPYRLEIHMPAHKGRSIGFLVAVLEEPKGEWKFLDGSILRSHPDALRRLLPGLPRGY